MFSFQNYTQYIPLYIIDLQQWMGTPSIYVYDCSHAGKIINHFKTFSNQDDEKVDILKLLRVIFYWANVYLLLSNHNTAKELFQGFFCCKNRE